MTRLRDMLTAFRFLDDRGYREVVTDGRAEEWRIVMSSGQIDVTFIDDRGQLMIDFAATLRPTESFPLNAVRRYVTDERVTYPIVTESGMPLASDVDFLRRELPTVERLLVTATDDGLAGLRRTLRDMSREARVKARRARDIPER